MRGRLVGALAVLALLAGCAAADPVQPLDAAPAEAVDPAGAAEVLATAVTELTAHFLDARQTDPEIVSDGATVDVAVAELRQALPLGARALGFLAATATELTRTTPTEAITAVETTVGQAEVVGGQDGATVATVELTTRTTPDAGAITEAGTTYALVLDGETLDAVLAWEPGLDSGTGLSSPTGSAQRFVDLVDAGDLDAAAYFAGGATSATELDVLADALTGAEVAVVELPQLRAGRTRVVYAVDVAARVLGRFEVTLGDPTTVVYSPTS